MKYAVLLCFLSAFTCQSQDIHTLDSGADLPVFVEPTPDQTTNIRQDKSMGINLILLGPTIVSSVSFDYFALPYVNLEAGIGIIGFFGGGTFHVLGWKPENRWTPYTGLYYSWIPDLSFDAYNNPEDGFWFPIGIRYTAKKWFSCGFEGYVISSEHLDIPAWIGLKGGVRF